MSTPSLLNIPYLYKAGTLYSQIPESGAGDFTVTRTTTPTAGRSTRINKNGLIELVADNVPRLDYPLGGAVNGCPALLVEPSVQNLLQRSEEFNDAYWSKSLGVVTQNQTIAPDGLTTADKYVVNNLASANSPINRVFTFSTNTTYTLSLFVKKADYNTASIRLSTTETGAIGNFFNLESGTATNNQIQDYGNGWYRVWVTFTTAATVTNGSVQLIRDAQVRDGVAGIFIWGAQLEVGSIATSYIPTTTAAVTRSAEVISRTSASALIGQSEGTIYAEVVLRNSAVTAIFAIDDGDTSDFISIIRLANFTIRAQIRRAGASIASIITSSPVALGTHKIALAYKNADYALYIDGVSAGTSANSTDYPATALTQCVLSNASYGPLNDRIRAVELYPNRLTNAQLATLTAL